MPDSNSKFGVVVGTAENNRYLVSYMGQIYPATYSFAYRFTSVLSVGDHVVVDRRIPSLELSIIATAFGDDQEGTPYGGTGGVIQPSDGGGSTHYGGYFVLDIGPGLDVGHLKPY